MPPSSLSTKQIHRRLPQVGGREFAKRRFGMGRFRICKRRLRRTGLGFAKLDGWKGTARICKGRRRNDEDGQGVKEPGINSDLLARAAS
jgi:hypothetical protein